jgi:hypothetical protein
MAPQIFAFIVSYPSSFSEKLTSALRDENSAKNRLPRRVREFYRYYRG